MILPTCFPMIPLQTLWLNQHHQTFRQHVKNFGWARCLFLPGNGGVQYNLIHWKGRWELNCTKINKEEPASTRPWSTTSTPLTQNYNWPKLVLIWISLDVILFCYMISGIRFIYIYIYIPYWCAPKSLFKKVSSKHRRQINRLLRNEILCWKFPNTRC